MFAYGELDIFLAMLEIRYMLTLFAFDMDMRHLLAPQGISSCEARYRAVAISSDTKWHISMLKLLFAETNNSFNVFGLREHVVGLYLFDCVIPV